ncbi:MAG: glycosyltransferase family 4 protein [Paludibacter sp.]|jgi:glycosyltransferase involved in cell wall biosynthesis|nr:glycosyltransferase family 4 protein [Paludibacter sp.]
MKDKLPEVMMVATARSTRGGLASYLKALEQQPLWQRYGCEWIETQIDRNLLLKLFYLIRSFFQFLVKAHRFDIIHMHTVPGHSVMVQMPVFLLARLLRKKIILHLHVSDQLKAFTQNKPFHFVLNRADRVIVLSQQAKTLLAEIYRVSVQVEVVHNASREYSRRKEVNRENIILVAGVLDRNKAYDVMIRAFAKVSPRFPEWKLVFAGFGEIEKARSLAHELGVSPKVEFPGWVSGYDKEILFSKATIYCLVSYNEGFPVAVLEAWWYELPVICTPAGGLADVLKSGENALVTEPGDDAQLAMHLERLMTDPELRGSLAAASHQLVREQLTQAKMNQQLEQIYTHLIL